MASMLTYEVAQEVQLVRIVDWVQSNQSVAKADAYVRDVLKPALGTLISPDWPRDEAGHESTAVIDVIALKQLQEDIEFSSGLPQSQRSPYLRSVLNLVNSVEAYGSANSFIYSSEFEDELNNVFDGACRNMHLDEFNAWEIRRFRDLPRFLEWRQSNDIRPSRSDRLADKAAVMAINGSIGLNGRDLDLDGLGLAPEILERFVDAFPDDDRVADCVERVWGVLEELRLFRPGIPKHAEANEVLPKSVQALLNEIANEASSPIVRHQKIMAVKVATRAAFPGRSFSRLLTETLVKACLVENDESKLPAEVKGVLRLALRSEAAREAGSRKSKLTRRTTVVDGSVQQLFDECLQRSYGISSKVFPGDVGRLARAFIALESPVRLPDGTHESRADVPLSESSVVEALLARRGPDASQELRGTSVYPEAQLARLLGLGARSDARWDVLRLSEVNDLESPIKGYRLMLLSPFKKAVKDLDLQSPSAVHECGAVGKVLSHFDQNWLTRDWTTDAILTARDAYEAQRRLAYTSFFPPDLTVDLIRFDRVLSLLGITPEPLIHGCDYAEMKAQGLMDPLVERHKASQDNLSMA